MPSSAVNVRQREILQAVRTRGFATIESLAVHFDVSAQTVRRDIIQLDEQGLLKRFHGGAGAIETRARYSYSQKKLMQSSAKIHMGETLARLLPDDASVFLDVETTLEAAAAALAARQKLRVFTHSLTVALAFAHNPAVQVEVAGGRLASMDGALAGSRTTRWLGDLRPDYAVIGCSGIDESGEFLDHDPAKIEIKRCAMRNARCNVLLADHTKFGRHALMRIAGLGEFDVLISDQPRGARFRRQDNGCPKVLTPD